MKKNARLKEIKNEIEWYGVKKRIADAMLKLGEAGFEFCGHGCGMGVEDFNLIKGELYVNFCDIGKQVVVTITKDVDADSLEIEELYKGTIGKALKYLKI